MSNALRGTMAAVSAGFIGNNPLEGKLAAIDKGIKDVQDWKTNIDNQRLELKQLTAKTIREAEKKAYENMPNDETAQAKVLEALSKYKDQLLMNQRLVQNGAIKPEDNLIFNENGKQTFNILAENLNEFDKQLEITKQRAQGYYNEEGKFIPPVSGDLEAAKQAIQTQIGTLSGIDINFTERGMGGIDFYQMEVDPTTNTYRPKRDADGNKILIDGQSNASVLMLKHKANTRANRVDMVAEVEDFSKSPIATNYEMMFSKGDLIGNIKVDARQNPGLKTNLNAEVEAKTTDIERVASIFSQENGFGGQLVPFTQYDGLSDDEKAETITVTVLDENLDEKEVTVPKYVRVAPANENNAIVPEMSAEQIEAAQGYYRKALVDGMESKIRKGEEKQKFNPYSKPSYSKDRDDLDTVSLIDQIVRDGNENSLQALVKSNPNVKSYSIDKKNNTITFTKADGSLSSPIPIGSGTAVDAGKLFAADLGVSPELYANKTSIVEGTNVNPGIVNIKGFVSETPSYNGLGSIPVNKKGNTIITAETYLVKEPETDMAPKANEILSRVRNKFNIPAGVRVVGINDFNLMGNDTIQILDENGNILFKNTGGEKENYEWLKKHLDKTIQIYASKTGAGTGGGELD
jgi:hypothetical protein